MTLPPLPEISLSSLPQPLVPPVPKIRSEEDVDLWKQTEGYQTYMLFIRRLNEAVVGHELQEPGEHRNEIAAILRILDEMERWIDEIPPLPTPQRFGNLAFRDWGKRLEDRCSTLVESVLPPSLSPAVPLLTPYLLNSFGSFVRIDYGSGHELCFALFLLCLSLLRFFEPNPEEERHLVLRVFKRYLDVVWKLQDVYRLEPAGSHGVWGLDDYHFLTFLWGSGQERNHPTSRPSSILSPPLAPSNLYNLSITRIHKLKTGPFHEHSSQLFSIASSVPNWGKVNQGLIKMYEAEVLGKRVVVQHVPLGGLLRWDVNQGRQERDASTVTSEAATVTRAPWAGAGRAPQSYSSLANSGSIASTNILPPIRTLPQGYTRQGTQSPAHGTMTPPPSN